MSKRTTLHCPYDCGGRTYKTTKGNRTRCCDREVVKVNGEIYTRLEDAPEWRIISKFIEMKRHDLPRYNIPYLSSSYREILPAAAHLLERCDGDVELAELAVELTFTHKDHKWRTVPTFFAVISKRFLPDVLARAAQVIQRRNKDEELQEAVTHSYVPSIWEEAYESARI